MAEPGSLECGSIDSGQLQLQSLEREIDAMHASRGEPAQRTIAGFHVKSGGSPQSPISPSHVAVASPLLRSGTGGVTRDEAGMPAPLKLPVPMAGGSAAAAAASGTSTPIGDGPDAAAVGAGGAAAAAAAAKKATTKAERRELQERQRAAKAVAAGGAPGPAAKPAAAKPASASAAAAASSSLDSSAPPVAKQHDTADATRLRKQRLLERTDVQKAVALFAHLPQYEREKSIALPAQLASQIHPVVAKLGLQYAEGVIQGANGRCVAMLNAFKEVIRDYRTPPAKALNRDLESKLRPQIQYLVDCRPVGINMGNAIKWLKARIASLPPHLSESDAKAELCAEIDGFVAERITLASAAISALGASKVADGDVIITYGCAHVVEEILLSAHKAGRTFRVVVIDARPHWEGRALWRRLMSARLDVSYAGMHALSYCMRSCTKVLMGAHACLSNGAVVSRAGSALVALCANHSNVPVLIACETYKFAERVMLDSICANELADPDDLVMVRPVRSVGSCLAGQLASPDSASAPALPKASGAGEENGSANVLACLTDWRDVRTLRLLNLTYDVTPCELVTMVISEVGLTPPTSIPVIIREYRQETGA